MSVLESLVEFIYEVLVYEILGIYLMVPCTDEACGIGITGIGECRYREIGPRYRGVYHETHVRRIRAFGIDRNGILHARIIVPRGVDDAVRCVVPAYHTVQCQESLAVAVPEMPSQHVIESRVQAVVTESDEKRIGDIHRRLQLRGRRLVGIPHVEQPEECPVLRPPVYTRRRSPIDYFIIRFSSDSLRSSSVHRMVRLSRCSQGKHRPVFLPLQIDTRPLVHILVYELARIHRIGNGFV